MNRNVLLSLALVAAAGLPAGCGSVSSLNPFSPDDEDLQPSFAEFVADQAWTVGVAIHMSLPAATGGNPPLSYELSPELQTGLTFDPTARTISGTPTAIQPATTYVYSATDDDDDSTSIQFRASVAAAAQ